MSREAKPEVLVCFSGGIGVYREDSSVGLGVTVQLESDRNGWKRVYLVKRAVRNQRQHLNNERSLFLCPVSRKSEKMPKKVTKQETH